MGGMSEQFVQQVEPEEAFAALTDETRLEILQELWESDIQTVPFSELRRAVGIRDPGQFNYHLGCWTFTHRIDQFHSRRHPAMTVRTEAIDNLVYLCPEISTHNFWNFIPVVHGECSRWNRSLPMRRTG